MKPGDPFYDKPVFKQVPVYCAKEPMVGEVFSHTLRTPLRWMEPDGKGDLRPMNNTNER